MVLNAIVIPFKKDVLKINNYRKKNKIGGKRNLPMLLCIGNLDLKEDEVVVVITSCVVVDSAGVPQVTLKFPPRPP